MNPGLATRLVLAAVQTAGSHALTTNGAASRLRARARQPIPLSDIVLVRSGKTGPNVSTSVWPYPARGSSGKLPDKVIHQLKTLAERNGAKFCNDGGDGLFVHRGEVYIEWPED